MRRHRLFKILQRVQKGESFTAGELAEEYDIARRTANTDARELADENEDIVYERLSGHTQASDPKVLRRQL